MVELYKPFKLAILWDETWFLEVYMFHGRRFWLDFRGYNKTTKINYLGSNDINLEYNEIGRAGFLKNKITIPLEMLHPTNTNNKIFMRTIFSELNNHEQPHSFI